jgi:hypothetical protein
MRVHQITCPKCGSGLKSKAGIPVGRTVPCPKCKTRFPVEAPDEPDIVDDADLVDDDDVVEELEVLEPAPRKKTPPPVPARKAPARRRRDEDGDETEEEESLPRHKARRRPADDTDEEPIPRRKKNRRWDEEEEEGLYLRLKHNVWVRVITLAVLLGILAVVAYLYYDIKIRQPAESNATRPSSGEVDDGR